MWIPTSVGPTPGPPAAFSFILVRVAGLSRGEQTTYSFFIVFLGSPFSARAWRGSAHHGCIHAPRVGGFLCARYHPACLPSADRVSLQRVRYLIDSAVLVM